MTLKGEGEVYLEKMVALMGFMNYQLVPLSLTVTILSI